MREPHSSLDRAPSPLYIGIFTGGGGGGGGGYPIYVYLDLPCDLF